jgi:hypothetical protein
MMVMMKMMMVMVVVVVLLLMMMMMMIMMIMIMMMVSSRSVANEEGGRTEALNWRKAWFMVAVVVPGTMTRTRLLRSAQTFSLRRELWTVSVLHACTSQPPPGYH